MLEPAKGFDDKGIMSFNFEIDYLIIDSKRNDCLLVSIKKIVSCTELLCSPMCSFLHSDLLHESESPLIPILLSKSQGP